MNKVTRGWIQFYKGDLRSCHTSPSIIKMIK